MYRPKGWKKLIPDDAEVQWFWMPDGNHIKAAAANALYEAGADAMLEELKGTGVTDGFYTNDSGEVCGTKGEFLHIPANPKVRGTVVFIPEEE